MSGNPGLLDRFRRVVDRRSVIADGIKTFAASFIAVPLFRLLFTVQAATPAPTPAPSPAPTPPDVKDLSPSKLLGNVKKKQIDPLFAPFLNEKLVYEVNFLWTIRAAEVTVTLRQGLGDEIIGELEAKSLGVVGWATNTKRQAFKSRLLVTEIQGTKRLVATNFSRLSEKGNTITKTLHHFDYKKRKWTFRKYVNSKRTDSSAKTIPANIPYYEDFVGFVYNLRAGVYGDMTPGRKFKIYTVPFKGADEYTIQVASEAEMKEEADWISKNPAAKKMGIVEIQQKIFGLKTGLGKVLADEKLVPIAGKVKDVVSFGDVTTTLVRRGKI